jgi:hypothetical protein
MNRFGRYCLIIGVAALAFALPLMAQQGEEMVDPVTAVTTVHWLADDTLVEEAEAMLTRMEHGLAFSLSTSDLEPGDVITAWWVIFNATENCSDGECGFDDVFMMDRDGNFILDGNGLQQLNRAGIEMAQITNLWGAGGIVDEDGTIYLQGHLPIGDVNTDVLFGNGLTNPMEAEVHLALRTHGPIQPGLLSEQLNTGWGGCPDPLNRAPCRDLQVAIFHQP